MFCKNCGNQIDDNDALFCMNCGAKVSDTVIAKYCAQCGTELEEDAVFCTNCGNRVNEEQTQTATENKVESENVKVEEKSAEQDVQNDEPTTDVEVEKTISEIETVVAPVLTETPQEETTENKNETAITSTKKGNEIYEESVVAEVAENSEIEIEKEEKPYQTEDSFKTENASEQNYVTNTLHVVSQQQESPKTKIIYGHLEKLRLGVPYLALKDFFEFWASF